MSNNLINETSPYLLQHAKNPVEWYPWDQKALELAKQENKPIFLSIGYTACHWCHVMAHESFENNEIADYLNSNFINIKVDREERPDIDDIYMNAVVAMTGQGGWPLNVFLTPDGEPFYGGTYFPPIQKYNIPAFKQVLEEIVRTWKNSQNEVLLSAKELTKILQKNNQIAKKHPHPISSHIPKSAANKLIAEYDWQYGGWGSPIKFPQPMSIEFLLSMFSFSEDETYLKPTIHALKAMNKGGIYDIIAGGFHRYSTDNNWLVPHFEKMLYDNALLARTYLHAYLITKDQTFKETCIETLDFIAREMLDDQGGFYSSLDADSNGEEGHFYTWSFKEISESLSTENFELLSKVYPITKEGNFKGKIILQRQEELSSIAAKLGINENDLNIKLKDIYLQLHKKRQERVRPQTDDKILTSWNALASISFSEAARYLNRPDYLRVAQNNTNFLLNELYKNNKLLRTWRKGKAKYNGYLEDYASLIISLLSLYQSDHNTQWFHQASNLAKEMIVQFQDKSSGNFYDTCHDHENLIYRPTNLQDNAIPSSSSLATQALLLLSAYEENDQWSKVGEKLILQITDLASRYPTSFSNWLQVILFAIQPVTQIAILTPENDHDNNPFLDKIWNEYRPDTVVAISSYPTSKNAPALLKHRKPKDGKITSFICKNFTCKHPITDGKTFTHELQK